MVDFTLLTERGLYWSAASPIDWYRTLCTVKAIAPYNEPRTIWMFISLFNYIQQFWRSHFNSMTPITASSCSPLPSWEITCVQTPPPLGKNPIFPEGRGSVHRIHERWGLGSLLLSNTSVGSYTLSLSFHQLDEGDKANGLYSVTSQWLDHLRHLRQDLKCLIVYYQSINQSIIYFDTLRRGAKKKLV